MIPACPSSAHDSNGISLSFLAAEDLGTAGQCWPEAFPCKRRSRAPLELFLQTAVHIFPVRTVSQDEYRCVRLFEAQKVAAPAIVKSFLDKRLGKGAPLEPPAESAAEANRPILRGRFRNAWGELLLREDGDSEGLSIWLLDF